MEAAYEAFRGQVGALVALDPRDGAVLAWLSMPSYDPTDLSGPLSSSRWAAFKEDPDKILLDRPTQAAYPPGSVHKILTALAALAVGKTDFQETVYCPGYYQSGNRRWGCWNPKGHGRVNLKKALMVSCDVFFYKLGERVGPDPIAAVARLFGLGARTGVLADSEREGLLPTEAWKWKSKKEKWTVGDSLGTAIGQGFNLVTPLQNALMIARFANGGKKITPRLLMESPSQPHALRAEAESSPFGVAPRDYEEIRQALTAVVNSPGGTGGAARLQEVLVAGKTGTAQVIGHEFKGKVAAGVRTENHAWFVAYAPERAPEIAVAVLVEHGGGGGGVAAPIAKRILEAYFRGFKE
jgi:penicillin-binding protein 2